MPLTTGAILMNRYRIEALLGQGGMGAVYGAVDLNLNLRVAVKENLDTSAGAQKQFGVEASLLARLSHASLPRVNDHFFIPNQGQYLVMDYIDGEDLESMVTRLGVLPENRALTWVDQVCDALAYLHRQTPPIIHRDIKPGNIRVTPGGQAFLVDFGIAKLYDPALATTMGAKAVTPGFSPPEQYGGGLTDARSDVYSLGATLYTALTGQTLPESVQRMVGAASIRLPRQLNPQISPQTESTILRAIEVATDRRFQSVDEFHAALLSRAARSGPIGPPPPTVPFSVPPTRFRRSWLVIGGIVLLLVLIGGSLLLPQGNAVTPAPAPLVEPVTEPPLTTISDAITSSPMPAALPTPAHTLRRILSGGFIAYEAGPDNAWQIYLSNPATGEVWPLPNQPANSGVPSWLPDGRIAFRSKVDGSWQIYTMNIDGSDLRQITFGGGNNYEPNYSPDGARLAFVSDRDGNKEIYVMDSDGQNQQRLTNNSGIDDDPNWSPAGGWIVFERRQGSRTDVYIMRPDGSGLQRLTDQGDSNSTPAWSPDGQWIAFERENGDITHVWIMDADGQNQRQITFDGAYNVRPAWSPTGRELAYNSDRGGPVEVWVTALESSAAPVRISEGEGFDPAWSRE
jgi:serine/threonine protein kinase